MIGRPCAIYTSLTGMKESGGVFVCAAMALFPCDAGPGLVCSGRGGLFYIHYYPADFTGIRSGARGAGFRLSRVRDFMLIWNEITAAGIVHNGVCVCVCRAGTDRWSGFSLRGKLI